MTGCVLFLGLVFGSQLVSPLGVVTPSTPINETAVSLTLALFPTGSPADREAAFAVLTANIAHYLSIFEQGQAIIGQAQHVNGEEAVVAMADPDPAAARFQYYRRNSDPEFDMSFLDAFRQADRHFTADNEPRAIRDWVDDMSFMRDDLSRWVHVAVDYHSSQADVDAAAETVGQDLAKAQADARAVQQG
ncbi:MAG: hypothetical protein ACRDQV_11125 [Pseudonocardiaceae bacterium]